MRLNVRLDEGIRRASHHQLFLVLQNPFVWVGVVKGEVGHWERRSAASAKCRYFCTSPPATHALSEANHSHCLTPGLRIRGHMGTGGVNSVSASCLTQFLTARTVLAISVRIDEDW